MSLTEDQAGSMYKSLIGQLASEHRTTISVIDHALDAKLAFTPHEKSRPFNTLAHHIYLAGLWFADIMETGKVSLGEGADPAPPAKKADLLAACESLHRQFINRLSALSPAALARPIEFPGMGPFAAVVYLEWHLHHLIHHRGQLSVYLRLMGAKVPSIYGPSADYPMMH